MKNHAVSPLSRRGALRFIQGAALAGMATRASADSANKVGQKAAGYQPQPKEGQSCAKCDNFHAPDGCSLVQGPISPDGWCRLFRAKTS